MNVTIRYTFPGAERGMMSRVENVSDAQYEKMLSTLENGRCVVCEGEDESVVVPVENFLLADCR